MKKCCVFIYWRDIDFRRFVEGLQGLRSAFWSPKWAPWRASEALVQLLDALLDKAWGRPAGTRGP